MSGPWWALDDKEIESGMKIWVNMYKNYRLTSIKQKALFK